jgi:hypothetical protein
MALNFVQIVLLLLSRFRLFISSYYFHVSMPRTEFTRTPDKFE